MGQSGAVLYLQEETSRTGRELGLLRSNYLSTSTYLSNFELVCAIN